MDEVDESPAPGTHDEAHQPHRTLRPVRSQRALQVVLGLFWVLDAALQFQPYMFTKGFVSTYVVANAGGQPAVIGWVITNVGHFLSPHIAVWNTFFALLQLGIGVGLLIRPAVRPALAVSFAWVLGVWFFGEGLGLILTGSASALTGAPGSVLIYGALGLMAWPRRERMDAPTGGIASSAAARGIGGPVTPLAVWSGYWVLAAILFVLPDNRTQTSVSSSITGMAPGSPRWYAHFLTSTGNHFGSNGTQSAWVLAVAALLIGLGPLVVRRPGSFLLAGGLLAALFWISGQGLGGILTGSGTDPNTGPLIVLLALAMVPATEADRASWRSPLSTLLRRYPPLALGGAASVALALLLSAAYPAPAAETTGVAMAGMTGMADSGAAGTATTASCTAGNGGLTRSGLDVTNSPYMVMGGVNGGMDMNGADASAAAGFNSTKANWHYTGPALPAALSRELLADGGNGPDDIHMAATGCAAEPTFSQEINAVQYVQSTSAAAARFSDPAAAVAAGYVAVSPPDYPVVYYVNPAVEAANAAARRTLNSGFIDGLVYVTPLSGTPVLAAAMYVKPPGLKKPPMPFGALVQWHERTVVCGPLTGSGATLEITGVPPCPSGTVQRPTPYLTMVWMVPVAGGPLAIQPPDIQIVEAATLQVSSS
jgi:hypothetical protein